MTVEDIAVLRADEQAQRISPASFRYVHERDGWDVPGKPEPRRVHRRTKCLEGECDRKVTSHGYCHMHWMRIRRADGAVPRSSRQEGQ